MKAGMLPSPQAYLKEVLDPRRVLDGFFVTDLLNGLIFQINTQSTGHFFKIKPEIVTGQSGILNLYMVCGANLPYELKALMLRTPSGFGEGWF